jgi:hypothetical protein
MPSSTNQVAPKKLEDETSSSWPPNVSQKTSAARRHFAPLPIEKAIAAFSIAIGPIDRG